MLFAHVTTWTAAGAARGLWRGQALRACTRILISPRAERRSVEKSALSPVVATAATLLIARDIP
jgi:hypothetical protein